MSDVEPPQQQQRFCRFCKCHRDVSLFSRSDKAKRKVCIEHMRTVYRLRHTVEGGGSIAVDHFRVLKNAYQVMSRDSRQVFKGLKPQMRIQDLAPFINASGKQFGMPLDPILPIGPSNMLVVSSIDERKTLLRLWASTRDCALYASTLRHFAAAALPLPC